ncbi:hypothetical protein COLO4_00952 [Corchorus olitorius]|uniref:Uncharacterized protein n=1 Tax=Corchorus olitorius TaxID=93759 RepID=A0A1R3L3C4_9ROSI|nr:hypothetical protein COLO4_00952 [Corchorus olitorius]
MKCASMEDQSPILRTNQINTKANPAVPKILGYEETFSRSENL